MMTFEIIKTFVASSAHVSFNDLGLLDQSGIITEAYEYGTRIFLANQGEHTCEGDSVIDLVSKHPVSDGLRLVVLFSVASNCTRLELDQDGPIYEEFPKYEW